MGHYDDQYEEYAARQAEQRARVKAPITTTLEQAVTTMQAFGPKTEDEQQALLHARTALMWWKGGA